MKPACAHFEELLSAQADGETTTAQRRAVETHLSACPECSERLADLTAASGAIHDALMARADEADFSGFADQVLARVTPHQEPLWARLKVAWEEIWTFRRGVILSSLATAALVLGVGGPIIWRMAQQGARDHTVVRSIGADDPNLTPVVMQSDDGATIVFFVNHGADEASGDTVEQHGVPLNESHGGEL